ncbi:Endonuclease, Uma2 family (restriction endonuclease fold) [Nocardia amikacinitolerans]|uniref:Uma2 family endonuclease n=1 Tax=Nocardia amikacinitolerans TaxID=756689 RepID=UPI0008356647|nr:Uma2 family endonuclease [Nocardia amikacinitolerans]MCP2317335.1 Endonuclease, Uma2 family (restriction endonuclease fold) [Nocardia amikacinitolerans]
MSVEPLPDWVIPPRGGYTVEAFLNLRGLPKHTELIDAGLVFASPRTKWHSRVVSFLRRELDLQAPRQLRAEREMAVHLAKRQMPEPDVLVVTAEAFEREEPSNYYFAADVILAVEVMSPGTEERDRETKPPKYARAGIPHHWRVERDENDSATVYAYEIRPATECYVPIGIFHDRLKVSVPFPIDIDLTTIGQRG